MIKEKWPFWEKISQAIGKMFAHLPFAPNTYSTATLILALAALPAVILSHYILAVVLFSLSGFLDIVDGTVARQTGKVSHYGAFLDGSLDRFVDFALIFSYFWLPLTTILLPPEMWICLAVFVALMPSFEVAYANHRRAVDDPEEKRIWRILNRGEMYPLMVAVILAANYSAEIAGGILIVWVVLSAITTLQTVYIALKLGAVSK